MGTKQMSDTELVLWSLEQTTLRRELNQNCLDISMGLDTHILIYNLSDLRRIARLTKKTVTIVSNHSAATCLEYVASFILDGFTFITYCTLRDVVGGVE